MDDVSLELTNEWEFVREDELEAFLVRLIEYQRGTREAYPESSPSRQH